MVQTGGPRLFFTEKGNVMRRVACLFLVLFALLAPSVTAMATAEGESELIVFVGEEVGQEVLIYCSGDEQVMSIGLYPYGGANLSIAPEGVSCDEKTLKDMFPGGNTATFDNPQKGWVVGAADAQNGSIRASRCNGRGNLISVTTGPERSFVVNPHYHAIECL